LKKQGSRRVGSGQCLLGGVVLLQRASVVGLGVVRQHVRERLLVETAELLAEHGDVLADQLAGLPQLLQRRQPAVPAIPKPSHGGTLS
jgi:Tfp pilus assembly protein PilN